MYFQEGGPHQLFGIPMGSVPSLFLDLLRFAVFELKGGLRTTISPDANRKNRDSESNIPSPDMEAVFFDPI